MEQLALVDWDFPEETSSGLHAIHPYPARFIPQIPRALISALTEEGDVVCDPFCGSGTTLVESVSAGRSTIGLDANPIACLISRAKLTSINDDVSHGLVNLESRALRLAERISRTEDAKFVSDAPRPSEDVVSFWFEEHVAEELAEIAGWCRESTLDAALRDLAQVALSSIIVRVSKQDSDTRYTRRTKDVRPSDTSRIFASAVLRTRQALSANCERRRDLEASVLHANVLDRPPLDPIDAVITSPPYPNAYSYHLYHRLRMLWLGMDPQAFKAIEIGSHRKYSSTGTNRAEAATFYAEMTDVLGWLHAVLRPEGYVAFVVGDSKIRGEIVDNAELLADAGHEVGFREAGRFERAIRTTRKAFNPAHGRIKTEKVLVLRKSNS
jgi:site-specific DNA-methyltransferase (cytosine-N4-specific)